MNDAMLYVMIAMLFGMFGWAGYEYAKAGYESWKKKRRVPTTTKPTDEVKE